MTPRWKRKRERENARTLATTGLTAVEIHILSVYNSERNRGLVHTEAWKEGMAELQQRFNRHAGR